jgi:hypothetical protein
MNKAAKSTLYHRSSRKVSGSPDIKKAAKSIILYHRSYRKVSGSPGIIALEFLLFALPFSIFVAYYFPELTRTVSHIAQTVLRPFFPRDVLTIVQVPFMNMQVFFVDLPSVHPSRVFSAVSAAVSLTLLVLLPRIRHAKHISIFLVVVAFINAVSSLFFTFFPYHFPYQAVDYSELYIKQQIGIWFFVPIILGLAILPLPSTILSKIITLSAAFCYSITFGTVRYAVFLYILTKTTLLSMAVLFFVLGPLVDFVYIVGIYSVHVARLANKMKGNFASWKWLY